MSHQDGKDLKKTGARGAVEPPTDKQKTAGSGQSKKGRSRLSVSLRNRAIARAIARSFSIGRKPIESFLNHYPFEKAAAVSYYTLLALAPLLLIVLALGGIVFGRAAVQGHLESEMRGLVGESGAEAIQLVIQNASAPNPSRFSLAIGILMLFIGASGVFLQLQSALNRIWGVEAAPQHSNIGAFVRHRLVTRI